MYFCRSPPYSRNIPELGQGYPDANKLIVVAGGGEATVRAFMLIWC